MPFIPKRHVNLNNRARKKKTVYKHSNNIWSRDNFFFFLFFEKLRHCGLKTLLPTTYALLHVSYEGINKYVYLKTCYLAKSDTLMGTYVNIYILLNVMRTALLSRFLLCAAPCLHFILRSINDVHLHRRECYMQFHVCILSTYFCVKPFKCYCECLIPSTLS